MRKLISLLILVAGITGCTPATRYDILIRNGRIIDGSGSASFTGDIGINADTIAAIGN